MLDPPAVKRIGFFCVPEASAHNSILGLARMLARRGHHVTCFGVRDSREAIEALGLEHVTVLEDIFPRGSVKTITFRLDLDGLGRLGGLARGLRQALTSIRDGTLAQEFAKKTIDLLLVDTMVWPVGIAARSIGLPVVGFTHAMVTHLNESAPPLSSGYIPRNGELSRLVIRALWLSDAKQRVAKTLFLRLFGMPDPEVFLREATRSLGITFTPTDMGGIPTWPEIALIPAAFDYPRQTATPSRLYMDAVDPDRDEPNFPWERLDDARPLVIGSFGTHLDFNRRATRFIGVLAEVARQRPRLQFALAIGDRNLEEFAEVPDNLVLAKRIPQLALLRRASLVVTHASLTTVRECIHFAVPMIVAPVQWDQFAVAGRVVFHGLGVRANLSQLDVERTGRHIDEVLADAGYAARIRALRERSQRSTGTEEAISLIERVMNGPPASTG